MSEPAPPPANSPSSNPPSIGRLLAIAIILIGAIAVTFWKLPPLGFVVAGATVVAFVWTLFVTLKGSREGRSVGRDEQVAAFATTLGSAFVVIIASCVGFVATCFPIGIFAFDEQGKGEFLMKVAFGTGTVTAIIAGCLTAAYLRSSGRKNRQKSGGGERKIC